MTEARQIYSLNADWLQVNGQADAALAQKCFSRLEQRVEQGEFTWDNVGYIFDVDLKAAGAGLELDQAALEKLRRACQLWNVDIELKEIKSHRKFVGFFIISAKKLVYPVIKAFMKDSLRQQRSFNAAMLAVSLDLYEKLSKQQSKL